MISHVLNLIGEKLIQIEFISADKQEADQLSKPCIPLLDEWRKNENLLGSRPDITMPELFKIKQAL